MTKTWIFTVFIILMSLGGFAQGGIDFRLVNWEEALDAAGKENKLMFVAGYVDWSQPCAILDKYTFSDQEVGAFYNEQFINIRLDMEDFPGIAVAEDLNITSYPALLFINEDGDVIHRGCGALESDELINLGEVALSDRNLSLMQTKYENGDRQLDFLVELSGLLQDACMDKTWIADAYFESTDHKDWMNETSWAMLNLNVSDPYSEPFQYLMSAHDEFALKYGKDTVDTKIYNVLIDQFIGIYEGEDLTLFATQSLKYLLAQVNFKDKSKLNSLAELKTADLKSDWKKYGEYASRVVEEQKVTDPDQLNEFSWKFYLHVTDNQQLEAARGWMKGVLTDYPDATYYDTYASLSYKLGDYKEAVKYGRKAIQAAEIQLEDLMHYKNQLEMFQSAKD